MVKTILIYFLLFAFWVEQVLGFKLTQTQGLSLMNVSIYMLLIAWAFSIIPRRKLIEPNNLNKYLMLFMLVVLSSIPVKILLGEVPNTSVLSEIIAVKNWMNPLIVFFILFNIIEDEKTCNRTLIGLAVFLMITVFA